MRRPTVLPTMGARRARDVGIETQTPLRNRRSRRPQHPFLLEFQPFQLVPAFIAPLLPGDTIKNGMVQCRIVSDPIISPFVGWWFELYLFYVRVGDLEVADTVRAAVVDPTQNMSSLNAAAAGYYYHQNASTPSWVYECLRVVTRSYFRREGENWNSFMIGNYPAVQLVGNSLMDSLALASVVGAGTGADSWAQAWSVYQNMRQSNVTVATWEEYLSKWGISTPPKLKEDVEDFRIPELIRFVRDFAYPVSQPDPTTGLVHAMLQWNIAERIDKRRFCAEPGFLVGYVCARPKVYLGNLRTSAADIQLSTNSGWIPPDFEEDPHTAIYKTAGVTTGGGAGIVHGASADYWADYRDLLLYGEQFVNFDPSNPAVTTGGSGASTSSPRFPFYNIVAEPKVDLSRVKYPDATDAASFFVNAAPTNSIRVDGVAMFNIASRVGVDVTI